MNLRLLGSLGIGWVGLLGHVVECALDWLVLVVVWAGLLAFIQPMWVSHLRLLTTLGLNFSGSFIIALEMEKLPVIVLDQMTLYMQPTKTK